jgi:hypothetical protein
LNATGGLNRWLRYDREEAYSDWLAWVLQQLNSREIVKLLRVEDGPTARFCCQHGFRVEREQCIPGGRLDLVLEFGQREGALIIVEVKTTSAEEADTAKQKGYCEWLYARPTRYKGQPILLAAGAEAHEYEGFAALEWSDLCIELRKMVPSLRKRIGLARAAMIIAFIGAVESNLLHLVTPSEGKHGQSLFYSRTIEHLRVSLRQR